MISQEEALKICLQAVSLTGVERIRFSNALGRVLAENISAKRNMPPFNKSAVDGYACNSPVSGDRLKLMGEISAGEVAGVALQKGECIAVMTGAPVPESVNWVVMFEHARKLSNGCVEIINAGRKSNIAICGEDYREGQLLIPSGQVIKAQHIALLAAEGWAEISVSRWPKVQIVSTGNELVEPHQTPGAVQIRNSNAWQLKAQLEAMHIPVDYHGIVRDEADELDDLISSCEKYNLSVFTGGVSMGNYDHVPQVIRDAGYEILFHKIAVKPGKPTLLAKKGNSLILGLPGNPVSAFIQFVLLGKPMLYAFTNASYQPRELRLSLGEEFRSKKSDRDSWIPVRVENHEIHALDYNGSGHLGALVNANAIMCIPADVEILKKGSFMYVRSI